MARIRTIKPEFPQSESMGRVSRESRLCFIMLWTLADDSGRLRGHSRMLASLLFPYDADAPSLIDDWLSELESERCIIRYVADGTSYVEICNWLNHQKIDRPSPSKIPPSDEQSRTIAKPRETSSEDLDQGSRIKEGIKDQVTAPSALPSSKYAFEGQTIRLTHKHFDKWREVYVGVPDLRAELTSLDDWITGEPAKSRKRWFHVVSGALKKRHNANAVRGLLERPSGGLIPQAF
jgi:hypothetical protein